MECICGTEIPQERLIVRQRVRGVGDLKGVTVKKKKLGWLKSGLVPRSDEYPVRVHYSNALCCSSSNSFLEPNSQERIFRGAAWIESGSPKRCSVSAILLSAQHFSYYFTTGLRDNPHPARNRKEKIIHLLSTHHSCWLPGLSVKV